MENRKAKCPLGGDGTQDCYGCTYPCHKNKKKATKKEKCPHGGDIENDCADCAYSGDYHYYNGECVKRASQR